MTTQYWMVSTIPLSRNQQFILSCTPTKDCKPLSNWTHIPKLDKSSEIDNVGLIPINSTTYGARDPLHIPIIRKKKYINFDKPCKVTSRYDCFVGNHALLCNYKSV